LRRCDAGLVPRQRQFRGDGIKYFRRGVGCGQAIRTCTGGGGYDADHQTGARNE